ncbi:TonB-dependent receptor domain-containing protein [uncultured Bacteroides sp.]|uniref:TonB-dependent receptor domain-containing protein n=1 Tax=uncultured Bacteroides sp. TaxID=162156 RepID=UPI002AAAA65D|nr:TonB-dependent receptor [uncultured Bacteroides sp.]
MRKLFFLILQCFFISLAMGQQINGKILDSDKNPIPYCNVVILSSPDSTFIQGVVTDDTGSFSLTNNGKAQKILRISCLGYETLYIHCAEGSIGTLILPSSSVQLAETLITAGRKVHKMRNGNIVTDIANSSLGKEHKTLDILKKIPGMTTSQGKLEVFGFGEPIVYIDNKKVNNKNEISMLDPQNIKEVELLTNPGAKYDASGKAILKITTLHKNDGWNIKIDLTATQSRKFSDESNLAVAYRKKGLTVSGLYNFSDYRMRTKQDLLYSLQDKSVLWKYDDLLRTGYAGKQHNYQVGFDYSITKNQSIGIQYSGMHSPIKSKANSVQNVFQDGNELTQIMAKSQYNTTADHNLVNLFYIGKFSKKLTLNANVDYVKNKNNQNQIVEENTEENNNEVNIASKTNSKLEAAKIELDYTVASKSTLTAGVEFNKIDIDGWLENPDNAVKSTQFRNKENKQAYYLMYNTNLGNYVLNAGCRYEIDNSKMDDLLDPENNIHRDYHNWFPSLSISKTFNSIQSSLSYSIRTTRPAFSRLNSNTYYDNRYVLQIGNPKLQPELSHNIQLLLTYKTLILKFGYSYIKDFINSVLSSQDNVIINSWKNYDNTQFFRGNMSYTKTVGCWNSTLSASISIPRFNIEYEGKKYNNNTPRFYAQLNNYLTLPKDFTVSVDYMYNNGGSIGIYKYKPYSSFNFGVQKSCFNDKLNIGFNVNDIFRTMVYKYDSRLDNIHFHQKEDQDEQNFSFSIVYRLNKIKSKYRGSGAAQDDIKRLN